MLIQHPDHRHRRKAALDKRIVLGGKTGTTQAYRDACSSASPATTPLCVWFGNDDYTSTNT